MRDSSPPNLQRRKKGNKHYGEIRPSLRIVLIYEELRTGVPFRVGEYHQRTSTPRGTIYRILNILSEAFPVVNYQGAWTLLQFVPVDQQGKYERQNRLRQRRLRGDI